MREAFRVTRQPADSQALRKLQGDLGLPLPTKYLALLRETNGAEWGVTDSGGDCLVLWPAEDVVSFNDSYAVRLQLNNAIAIGSDGGDDAILLLLTRPDAPDSWQVARAPFAALEPPEILVLAPTFSHWVARRFAITPMRFASERPPHSGQDA